MIASTKQALPQFIGTIFKTSRVRPQFVTTLFSATGVKAGIRFLF